MEDGKHAFSMAYCLNLSLICRYSVKEKNVFFILLSLFSYSFHENETFPTVRGVDFHLFRD